VFGGLAYNHSFCKRLVHQLDGDLVAFDVDYRLAPEIRFPVPVEDYWAAFNWVGIHTEICIGYSSSRHLGGIQVRFQKVGELHLDLDRFAVGGVSAGGRISAVISHVCRDADIPLRLQVLAVLVTDLHSVFTPQGDFDRENCPFERWSLRQRYQQREWHTAIDPS
jgi:acetyl esterase/lipase